jgi:hypothetical protein
VDRFFGRLGEIESTNQHVHAWPDLPAPVRPWVRESAAVYFDAYRTPTRNWPYFSLLAIRARFSAAEVEGLLHVIQHEYGVPLRPLPPMVHHAWKDEIAKLDLLRSTDAPTPVSSTYVSFTSDCVCSYWNMLTCTAG